MTDVGSAAPAPRTLAEWLRGRADESLQALLVARPDLARPAPVDMTQLAVRAATPASVSRAVDTLDALHLGVLSTLAALDDPTDLHLVESLTPLGAETVRRAVEELSDLALVWGSHSWLRTVRAVGEVLGPAVATAALPTAAPPVLDGTPADPDAVDAAAAGAAFEAVRRIEMLLDAWAESPPGVLRSGGIGVRDVRASASMLGVDEAQAGFLMEAAAIAGLVDRFGEPGFDEVWQPTSTAARWPEQPTAHRWADLAAAWLASSRATALLGEPDERGRPSNPLVPDLTRPQAQVTRQLALRALSNARPRRPTVDTIIAWVAWHRPRRLAGRDTIVRRSLVEAGWLGLAGRGVLSTAGARLLDGGDAAGAVQPLLPRPVDAILLQADLTAVAPGPLERDVAVALTQMADVESRGGATVYRFTAGSLRRAFDAGWPAAQIHAFLAEHSRTPVPQPLTYLVDDAARRHGRLRVGGAGTYVRSDDPAELDALVGDRALADLRLARLAPTVAVSELPADDTLRRLREAGHAPVAERSGSSQADRQPLQRRTRAPRPTIRSPRLAMSRDEAALVVNAVRAGDQAAAHRPGDGIARRSATALDVMAALRDAAQDATSVWLSYVDRAGTLSERIVDPLSVDAGWLTAHDHRSDRTRTFALHRIRQVAPLA